MIDALEAIGGDPSVLAHHAAARPTCADPALRPAAGTEAARSGAHREAVAFYELALGHAERDPDAARRCSRPCRGSCTSPTGSTTRSRPARGRWRCAGSSATSPRSARATARSRPCLVRRRPGRRRAARRRGPRDPLGAGDPRALGYALANHSFLAAQRGDLADALTPARARSGSPTTGRRPALHGFASIGLAVARLLDGDLARGPTCSRSATSACATAIDDLATAPMSNLAHLDVEQGRFAQAEDALADALRISEQRDIPICSMWQRGRTRPAAAVAGALARRRTRRPGRARRGRPPVGTAVAPSRARPAGGPPRRTGGEPAPRRAVAARVPARQPGQIRDRRGRAGRTGVDHPPARPAPRRPARHRRSPPRRSVTAADSLRCWLRRLADAGVQDGPRARRPGAGGRAVRTGAGAVGRGSAETCWPRSPCSTISTPGRGGAVPGPAARAGGDGVPRGRPRPPGPTRPG